MIGRWSLNKQLSVVSINVITDILICKYIPVRQIVYIEEHGPEDVTYFNTAFFPQQVLRLYCPTCYEITGHPCAAVASDYRGGVAPELAQ